MFLYRVTLQHHSGFYGETIHEFRHDDEMAAQVFDAHCRECLADALKPDAMPPTEPDEDPIALIDRRFDASMKELDYQPLVWTDGTPLMLP